MTGLSSVSRWQLGDILPGGDGDVSASRVSSVFLPYDSKSPFDPPLGRPKARSLLHKLILHCHAVAFRDHSEAQRKRMT